MARYPGSKQLNEELLLFSEKNSYNAREQKCKSHASSDRTGGLAWHLSALTTRQQFSTMVIKLSMNIRLLQKICQSYGCSKKDFHNAML